MLIKFVILTKKLYTTREAVRKEIITEEAVTCHMHRGIDNSHRKRHLKLEYITFIINIIFFISTLSTSVSVSGTSYTASGESTLTVLLAVLLVVVKAFFRFSWITQQRGCQCSQTVSITIGTEVTNIIISTIIFLQCACTAGGECRHSGEHSVACTSLLAKRLK